MNSFLNLLENLIIFSKDFLNQLDKESYFHLIQCLKLRDPIAVKEALNELYESQNKSAIAAIYLCSKKHPSRLVQKEAQKVLDQFISQEELQKILGLEKDLYKQVCILIKNFGPL